MDSGGRSTRNFSIPAEYVCFSCSCPLMHFDSGIVARQASFHNPL